jgi:hypothetical protein
MYACVHAYRVMCGEVVDYGVSWSVGYAWDLRLKAAKRAQTCIITAGRVSLNECVDIRMCEGMSGVRLACVNVQDGTSSLHRACYGGHLEVVEYVCGLGCVELLLSTNKVRVCVCNLHTTFMQCGACT